MNLEIINDIKVKSYRYYVRSRNFFVNNFFVNILCLKQNNTYTYLDGNYIFYRYLLILIPFYFIKLIANRYNTEIIYKVDGIYGITNIKENHIIPFITSCTAINEVATLNISQEIRLYNSSIPLLFFINYEEIYEYNSIKLTFITKGIRKEKEINLRDINLNEYLIYHLFEN